MQNRIQLILIKTACNPLDCNINMLIFFFLTQDCGSILYRGICLVFFTIIAWVWLHNYLLNEWYYFAQITNSLFIFPSVNNSAIPCKICTFCIIWDSLKLGRRGRFCWKINYVFTVEILLTCLIHKHLQSLLVNEFP